MSGNILKLSKKSFKNTQKIQGYFRKSFLNEKFKGKVKKDDIIYPRGRVSTPDDLGNTRTITSDQGKTEHNITNLK